MGVLVGSSMASLSFLSGMSYERLLKTGQDILMNVIVFQIILIPAKTPTWLELSIIEISRGLDCWLNAVFILFHRPDFLQGNA